MAVRNSGLWQVDLQKTQIETHYNMGNATPGVYIERTMGKPLVSHLGKCPPAEGWRRALFRASDEVWEIGPTQRPSYYSALEMFKKFASFLDIRTPSGRYIALGIGPRLAQINLGGQMTTEEN